MCDTAKRVEAIRVETRPNVSRLVGSQCCVTVKGEARSTFLCTATGPILIPVTGSDRAGATPQAQPTKVETRVWANDKQGAECLSQPTVLRLRSHTSQYVTARCVAHLVYTIYWYTVLRVGYGSKSYCKRVSVSRLTVG